MATNYASDQAQPGNIDTSTYGLEVRSKVDNNGGSLPPHRSPNSARIRQKDIEEASGKSNPGAFTFISPALEKNLNM